MSFSWENNRKEAPLQGTDGFWGGTGGGLGVAPVGKASADWASLTTGQSYLSGKIYRDNSNNMMYLYYYAQSRINQNSGTALGGQNAQFVSQYQEQVKFYAVGGGGGGRGENSPGGGGGGGFYTSNWVPIGDGVTVNCTAGEAGVGGYSQNNPNAPAMQTGGGQDGNNSQVQWTGNFVGEASSGKAGTVANTSTAPGLGQPGNGSVSTNNTGATVVLLSLIHI